MAKVTPTPPVRAFRFSSFNIPANFTNRGTGSVGTNSGGVCTVRLGACRAAATGCCACIPSTPKPNTNSKVIQRYLAVRFIASPLSGAEEIGDFLSGRPQRTFAEGDEPGKPGDDPKMRRTICRQVAECQGYYSGRSCTLL